MLPLSLSIVKAVGVVCVFVSVAFYTLLERKILGYAQIRKGAAKPSVAGILVPFADAIKLILKQSTLVSTASSLYWLAGGAILTVPVLLWVWWPLRCSHSSSSYVVVLILALFSAQVFGSFGAGWGSGSKYSVVGGLRAVAQTVSYEIVYSFLFLISIVLVGYTIISGGVAFWSVGVLACFLVCCLAESMRTPFDFVEGESELVSGFNTEYSGIMFVLIFLGEYAALMLLGALSVWLWVGGGVVVLGVIVAVGLLVPRATLPRLRYDQLMYLVWKSLLPVMLVVVVLCGVLCWRCGCFESAMLPRPSVLVSLGVIGLVAAVLVVVVPCFSSVFASLPNNSAAPFECGFEPSGMMTVPFCPKFWLVAILFLLFDVEVALLIPMSYSVGGGFVFLMGLVVGAAFEYTVGSLDWVA